MLHEWAIQWGVPLAALQDLQRRIGVLGDMPEADALVQSAPLSEGAVSNAVRMEASRKGKLLWRNNVGAIKDLRGVPVRFGLANDSAALNKRIKSADLIGIEPVLIGPEHLGQIIGRFLSVETKEQGWHFTATEHEVAQQAWATRVIAAGGRALFVNREGML